MSGPTVIPEQSAAVGALTDGTGISRLTGSKVLKDFVADLLLSGAAALVTVQVTSLQGVIAAPDVVAFAVAGSTIRVVYRFVLRWATTS